MPTTITLYHFNELSEEAKLNALEFWKTLGEQDIERISEKRIERLVDVKVDKFIRKQINDNGLPNQKGGVGASGFLYLPFDKTREILGVILYTPYLALIPIYNMVFKVMKRTIPKELREELGWNQRQTILETIVVCKIKTQDGKIRNIQDNDPALNSLIKSMTDKFTEYVRKIERDIKKEAQEYRECLLIGEFKEIIEQEKVKIVNEEIAKCNLNYDELGNPFHDQYYESNFPWSSDRWDY
jgi:bifunctional DNA-binding transcriptional regulator/antitoxin component of YhaV-PrlF toxin-antitoxin module